MSNFWNICRRIFLLGYLYIYIYIYMVYIFGKIGRKGWQGENFEGDFEGKNCL